MDHSITDLNALVAKGKAQGYLTYDQVNAYLPDEAVNPEKLDNLLMALDEAGIELLTDPPADAVQPVDGARAPAGNPEEEIFRIPAEDLPKLSDDPIRMYLSQMADIPLLTRERRNLAWPRRSKSRASDFAAPCWAATSRCRRPSKRLKKFTKASCRSIARSRCR